MERSDTTIELAVQILGAAAREDVEQAIENLCYQFEFSLRRSKKGKIAALRLAKALRRVDIALKDHNLWFGLKPDSFLTRDKILRWIDMCETTTTKSHRRNDNEKPGAFEKRAAEYAYKLMSKYGRTISTTKKSRFEQLAAALAGRPNANFHHYCRAILESAKTGAK
jgi:hypothetical protein